MELTVSVLVQSERVIVLATVTSAGGAPVTVTVGTAGVDGAALLDGATLLGGATLLDDEELVGCCGRASAWVARPASKTKLRTAMIADEEFDYRGGEGWRAGTGTITCRWARRLLGIYIMTSFIVAAGIYIVASTDVMLKIAMLHVT